MSEVMQNAAATMQSDAETMQSDAQTMQSDAETMQSDAQTMQSVAKTRRLSTKQFKALRMLADGASPLQITSKLKLRRTTLARWQAQPEFAAEQARLLVAAQGNMADRLSILLAASLSNTPISRMFLDDVKHLQMVINILKNLEIESASLPSSLPPSATEIVTKA